MTRKCHVRFGGGLSEKERQCHLAGSLPNRELVRAGKMHGLARLNAFNAAEPDRFLSVTDTALLLGADLWARSRNAGTATADPKELDADVLIAAQVLDLGLPPSGFIIATTNIGHLAQFAPADLWTNITP